MAFYTPGGLHIRFDPPEAFTLMARLWPRRRPDEVLTTTEGLEALPFMVWHVAAFVALANGASPLVVVAGAVAAELIGVLMLWIGLLVERPGLASLGVLWNKIPTIPRWAAVVVLAYALRGWVGVATYAAAYAAAFVAHWPLAFVLAKLLALPVTTSEIAFLRAYRFHARRLGVPTETLVSAAEVDRRGWVPVAQAYPGRVEIADERTLFDRPLVDVV